jgi:transcriptional regulator with XRE-family HTH domain
MRGAAAMATEKGETSGAFATNTQIVMNVTHLSQQDVADLVGVSRPLVSTWVRNKNRPDVYQAASLAKALGVPLDALVGASPGEITPEWIEKARKVYAAIEELGLDESYRRLLKLPDGRRAK